MAQEGFDLIVIGTGTAASTVASACRSKDWKVAVIDSRPFGGTCALRGCEPKKILVGAAEAIDSIERLKSKEVVQGDSRIDWPSLMRFKRTFTDPVPEEREKSFSKAGIKKFHGRARFTGPLKVQVGSDTLEGKYVLIAAGSKPMTLGIPGEEHLTTSDRFLDLDVLPQRAVLIGGGYISMEFAHVLARAGVHTTILHNGERILPGFDPDLITQLTEKTRSLGIELHVQTTAAAIEKSDAGLQVIARQQGKAMAFKTDLVIHGAGRVPEIEDMNLAAAGVESGAKGVTVNEYLQSVSHPKVYAAGDAAASGGLPLTPVAGYEGRIVAANLLEGNHLKPDYRGIPTVAFTTPPVASVGLSEKAAREQGLKFKVNHADTGGWNSSRRIGETCSGFKVLIEEASGRILGAHLLGPHAEETINFFALAIRQDIMATALKETLFAYPTQTSDIQYML
ncbi:MAG TPA: NAD(P)/FAD-dependent oxidoreductase [Terriglobia bacterium]|nr:NAD(P)/FAD-dependent oxidoreductase [Terriglobia bacterium]